MTAQPNADPAELAKFEALASRWWDPAGEFRPLHQLNPVRLAYIENLVPLQDKRVLDVGCGGGILTEAMADAGASVTGIDLAEGPLAVARLHLLERGLDNVRYLHISAAELATQEAGQYDLVTCMEVLEHVPDPAEMLSSCRRLVKPGGHVICSTINRNAKSFALGIVAAEYLLGLLPRGTHEYSKLIRPSELARFGAASGLTFQDLTGLEYDIWTRAFCLGADVDVNYLMHFIAPPN